MTAPLARPPVHFHSVHFQRHSYTGVFHAECVCGWSLTGTREEVQTRAATHDLDAEAVS